MEKDEFILVINETRDIINQIGQDNYEEQLADGYNLSITAWYPGLTQMVDEHITEHYPELLELGFDEPQEGDMYASGNRYELFRQLQSMGFQVFQSAGNNEPPTPQWDGPIPNSQWPTGIDDPRDLSDLDPSDVHYDLNWDEDRKQYDLGVNTRMDVDQLKRDMKRAAEREDYEKAAKLRDVIKKILGEEIKRFKKRL
jgi:hypothetical protein